MDNQSKSFEDLLIDGILAIQRNESKDRKKKIKEIEEELSQSIKRQVSTIEWYKKGNLPISQFEIEQLAKEIFTRGNMDKDWLEWYLRKAQHPNWKACRDEILSKGKVLNEPSTDILYKRMIHIVRKRIFEDGSSSTYHHSDLVAISNTPLPSIRHRVLTSGNSIEQFKLDFIDYFRDDGGIITTSIHLQTSAIRTWYINFLPPLLKDHKASYSYNTFSQGCYCLTAEDVFRKYREGTFRKEFDSWSYNIVVPTDQLTLEIEFPANWPLNLPTGGFNVYCGVSEILTEKSRILQENGFNATLKKESNQWIVQLSVTNAKNGYAYEFQWLPPYSNK